MIRTRAANNHLLNIVKRSSYDSIDVFYHRTFAYYSNIYFSFTAKQILTESYYESWANVSQFGTEQQKSIMTAGYYSINSSISNLKIVSVNTNYG